MTQFLDSKYTETLRGKRAYDLFSRIVHYAPILKGISSITMGDFEAVATISVPFADNIEGVITATKLCDTISLDAFIQVAGLLINSSDQCLNDEVFLATGVENFSMAQDCDLNICRSWTVYAMFTPVGDGKASGDVFVFREKEMMVLSITGVQFTKIPISKLEKMLASVNQHLPLESVIPKATTRMKAAPSISLSVSQNSEDGGESPPLESGSQTSLDSEPEDIGSGSDTIAKLKTLVASYVGLAEDQLAADASMAELGVDSLAATELESELEEKFSKTLDGSDIMAITFGELCSTIVPAVGSQPPEQPVPSTKGKSQKEASIEERSLDANIRKADEVSRTCIETDPLDALMQCQGGFEQAAEKGGFKGYWQIVAPEQDQLLLAYTAEIFEKVGVNLSRLRPGDTVPQLECLPKHSRLVRRLYEVLKRLDIISEKNSVHLRTGKPLPDSPSSVILDELIDKYPKFANEHRLMAVTAPHLADCMTGKLDPVDVLFGSSNGQHCLGDFYANSPQLATATEVLLDFVSHVMSGSISGTIKVLEVGGGFGGTTARLVKVLEALGQPVEYSFTDVSSLLVKKARQRFSAYPWMTFQTLNLEKDPDFTLQGKYDFVLGTNVVHATTNIVQTVRRLKTMLKAEGFIVLSEVLRVIDWYDLVYGPLDGWWCMTDGREYPLQPSKYWMDAFKEAGFHSSSFTGTNEESLTQSLLVGSMRQPKVPPASMSELPHPRLSNICRIETTAYKVVDDVSIMADIYYPDQQPPKPMPIGNTYKPSLTSQMLISL